MKRARIFGTVLSAIFVIGCGTDGDNDGEVTGSGNKPQSGAILTGRVDPGVLESGSLGTSSAALHEDGSGAHAIRITVNQVDREVPLGEDLTFAVAELPTGDITFGVRSGTIAGQVQLSNVQPGELIDIEITGGDGTLVIRVVRRDKPEPAPPPPPEEAGPLVIRGNKVMHRLPAGVIHRDVVLDGNHITLVGYSDGTCDPARRTVIDGDLTIRGNKVTLVNITVLGQVHLNGNHFQAYDDCDPQVGWPRAEEDRDHDSDHDSDADSDD